MVVAAATSAFFPVASPSSDYNGKPNTPESINLGGLKQKRRPNSLQVKANAQTPDKKINGTAVSSAPPAESLKTDDVKPHVTPTPRTFINQLPDWSMLLAAITTAFLAAEKQWMMVDWKPKRSDMLVDPFGFGRIVQDGLAFQQNFSIRSYEIGADGTTSIETLMNHLQETAINHVKSVGLLGGGFGATPEMCKRNLVWVVTRMQLVVDKYPTWGDVVQVNTWASRSGKNGLRRDWLVHDCRTGQTLTRGSSVWVLMNKLTRRLSKLPDEVRGEIEPYLMNSDPVVDEDSRKLQRLDDNTADYVRSGLTPRWSDLDVNYHVNNVKYIGWIIESAPQEILDTHELASMTVEYRRECLRDSVIRSLSAVSSADTGNHAVAGNVECQHLLSLENGAELMRGRTEWRLKRSKNLGDISQVPPREA